MSLAPAAAWAAALLPAMATGAVAACTAPQWALSAGAEHSRWQEHDSNGLLLLQESGTLATLALQGQATCHGLLWRATLGLADGRRGYQGVSSTGQPIRSHSGIKRKQVQLTALLPLAGGWSAGAALGHQQLRRDIASAGTVKGYPERFVRWEGAALLAHSQQLQLGLMLQTELQLGGGPGGRLHLHLPTADALTLRLGHSLSAQLTLALQAAPATASPLLQGWRIALVAGQTRSGAGPAATLWRNGLPVGAAAQPAIRQTALGLQAALQW